MADMTRETREQINNNVNTVIDHFCKDCKIKKDCKECGYYKTFEILRKNQEKLDAYENADLIERNEATGDLDAIYDWVEEKYKAGILKSKTIINKLPRFNPNEKGE